MKSPSKELLTEVLGYLVTNVSLVRNNHINITGATEKYTPATVSYNIYELAHKFKEWAYDKGYIINTALEPLTHKVSWQYDLFKLRYEKIDMDIPPTQHFIITKSYDTEPEAVFKAGERVLKETK